MSPHHPDLSLPDLLAQVDRLQQELKDLDREVGREENHVAHLEMMITKDQEKETKLRQDVSNVSKELLEWEDRERFLAGAIDSNYQNYQVLLQMQVEGKTKLSQERKKSDDLYKSLKTKFDFYQKKQQEELEILNALPGFVEGKEVEEKKTKLAEMRRENQRLQEEIAARKETKKNDWEGFVKTCVSLAESGVEANKKWEKLISSRQELSRRSRSSQTQLPTEDVAEEMDTAEEEEEVRAESLLDSSSQEERMEENSEAPEESQQTPAAAASQFLSPDRPRLSTEVNKVLSPAPATPTSSDVQEISAVTPSTPKTKTFQLGLGSSIISSLRRFREKSNSPAKDVEMEDVGNLSSVKTPEVPQPQFHRSPAKTPKLKSFKLGMPSFLKKKPLQDQSQVEASVAEGETKVMLPVKTITTATAITTTTNNNNQSESEPAPAQPQKKPLLKLSSTGTRAKPKLSQEAPKTLMVQPRLSLSTPSKRKEEAEGRRSLDQLTISGNRPGQIALKKAQDPEISIKEAVAVEAEEEARPRTGMMFNLQKPSGLRKSLGENLQKPKNAAAPEESVDLQKPKKTIVAAPEESVDLQKPRKTIAAAPEESVELVEENKEEKSGGAPSQDVEQNKSVESMEESKEEERGGSPRKEDDQDSTVATMFSSPGQANFLVSPTEEKDFFSDLGNDFSSDFFGRGNDKDGEEGGEDRDNFFSNFDDCLPEDGGFPFFGDSENKDTGLDDDFFFRGEEKDDNEDGGFNFF